MPRAVLWIRELQTLRFDDARDPLDEVLPVIRSALELESIGVYSVREHADGWRFDRWSLHEMPSARIRKGMLELFERRDVPVLFYDLARPLASQRNRLIEVTSMIDATFPGGWREAPLCREVLAPVGLGHQQQHRMLLCEGASLLAWFGGFHRGPLSSVQQRMMRAVARPLRQRLHVDRMLDGLPRRLAAVEAALAYIGGAAFVVTGRGAIAATNDAARRLLATDDSCTRTSLRDAGAGRPSDIAFDLTAITERGTERHWLAIERATPAARLTAALKNAEMRCRLTARQTEVLACVVRGLTNAATAAELALSLRTVELHVTALLDRFGVDNRAALVGAVLAR